LSAKYGQTQWIIFYFIFLPLTSAIFAASIFSSAENSKNRIIKQIAVPRGYERVLVPKDSFGAWLRRMPLKPADSPALDYKNRIKKSADDTTVAAVAAMNIYGKNLDQCMDILMRLYAEYLLAQRLDHKIAFPLPDGTMLSWLQWESGFRFYFKGYHFHLRKSAPADTADENFEKYLRAVFEYSGTQAFYHYYQSVTFDSLRIGDFIVKKNPHGHAVMVVDLAQDQSGNKIALFGQGDTPACQFYLLNYKTDNPWFPISKKQDHPPLPIKKAMKWTGLRRF
jgi:hypothetical protein